MAEVTDVWSANGGKHIWARGKVVEMQSEAGAGTVHGSLAAGALTTTHTASQGLLFMIPNLYKIAGDLFRVCFMYRPCFSKPCIINIGDHSDVYMHAVRTGCYAM